MAKVITLGETMVCFSPDSAAPLRYVSSFHPRIAGAESNLAVGLAKLGHEVLWISRLGGGRVWPLCSEYDPLRGRGHPGGAL